jgi:membrane protease YdiL (CAAX protease family)
MLEDTVKLPEPTPGRPPAPGWRWRDVGLALLTMVIGAVAIALLARAAGAALGLAGDQRLTAPIVYAVGLGVYLAVILGVYLFAARRAGWAALGLRPARWVWFALVPPLFFLELFLLVLVNGAVSWLAGGFENPQVEALTGGQLLAPGELLALLFLVAVVAPFAEELFFRGMIYPLLRARMAVLPAVGLNAAIFAAVHFIPLLLPGLFLVGLFLAYLRERSGSIWPPIAFHALQNALALLAINAALTSGAL